MLASMVRSLNQVLPIYCRTFKADASAAGRDSMNLMVSLTLPSGVDSGVTWQVELLLDAIIHEMMADARFGCGDFWCYGVMVEMY
jgi:hypothetical protein